MGRITLTKPNRLLHKLFLIPLLSASLFCSGQSHFKEADSLIESIQKIPSKYFDQVDNKIDKYSSRIANKTEKSLSKLARWENKIHTQLQKINPEADARLFGNNQLTFSSLLENIKKGKQVLGNYRERYDSYRDKLITSIQYLNTHSDALNKKYVKPIASLHKKIDELNERAEYTEKIEAFVKERKRHLMSEAFKYIGKSKYINKINKEAYYYVETMRNYKQLFSDKKKAEIVATNILNKTPAFQKFFRENGRLASLFGINITDPAAQNLNGMQTRASVNAIIQQRAASGGANGAQYVSQNIHQAHNEIENLKRKFAQSGRRSSFDETPNFKPNSQKTKTFWQRIEVGGNLQFGRNNSLVPTTADVGLSAGYKLNDKSIVGIGASYKMGLGSFQHIAITHEGIGLRSFIDWKLKKQFYLSGGLELNYNSQFKNIEQLKSFDEWQQSGLVGISKKLNFKTKWFNGSKIQLLYDAFARIHIPVSQSIIFRVGYSISK
jgi:prefoldin subunit 5